MLRDSSWGGAVAAAAPGDNRQARSAISGTLIPDSPGGRAGGPVSGRRPRGRHADLEGCLGVPNPVGVAGYSRFSLCTRAHVCLCIAGFMLDASHYC